MKKEQSKIEDAVLDEQLRILRGILNKRDNRLKNKSNDFKLGWLACEELIMEIVK